MTTVVVQDPEIADDLIKERRARGHDLLDEVREGVYYVVPVGKAEHGRLQMAVGRALEDRLGGLLVVTGPINLGEEDNYRIPDAAAIAADEYDPDQVWVPRAELVVEIRSVDDDTFDKFNHYARHDVAEIVVVDLKSRTIAFWRKVEHNEIYEQARNSELLQADAQELASAINL